MDTRTPSVTLVKEYIKIWKNEVGLHLPENSLQKIFNAYPKNTNVDEVLFKVSALNTLYGTRIFAGDAITISQHIVSLSVDKYFKVNDLEIVNKITNSPTEKRCFSFATKYCSFHVPQTYSLYDQYVYKLLMYFKKHNHFTTTKGEDMYCNYPVYHDVLTQFMTHYKLTQFTRREIDYYLWMAGQGYIEKYLSN